MQNCNRCPLLLPFLHISIERNEIHHGMVLDDTIMLNGRFVEHELSKSAQDVPKLGGERIGYWLKWEHCNKLETKIKSSY